MKHLWQNLNIFKMYSFDVCNICVFVFLSLFGQVSLSGNQVKLDFMFLGENIKRGK